jgi:polysaccharide pyruvyl transferase WcaK-like protein
MTKHFVYGYFGWKNTGDDAMLYAWLDRMDKDDEALILSRKFSCIPQGKKVKWIRYNFFKVALSIIKSSRFVIVGGTHLSDYGTPRRIFIILGRIFFLTLYAKILGKYVSFDNIGIVCCKWWSRVIINATCKLANNITVRDKASLAILNKMDIHATYDDDLTRGLLKYVATHNTHKHIIGVSVTPLNTIYHHDRITDLKIALELAHWVDSLLASNEYDEAHLIIFKGESKEDDVEYTHLLYSLLKMRAKAVIISYNANPLAHFQNIADCELVYAMRFHACYYAHLVGVPFISLSKHPKNISLLEDIKWNKEINQAETRAKRILHEIED